LIRNLLAIHLRIFIHNSSENIYSSRNFLNEADFLFSLSNSFPGLERMGVPFKHGYVTIVVDMLKRADAVAGDQDNRPEGTIDYIRIHSGIKMRAHTILLSNIGLPILRQEMRRTSIIQCAVLSSAVRVEGMDVHRLQSNQVKMLFECEG
jgi:hypothetical protein